LINIRDEILCSRSGGAQPNISQRVIGSLNVVLPPLPEQRAIARALRAVQGAREARLREVALERERKAALMEHLFTHGTRGEATKMTEIGEMPESWRLVKFGEIAKFKNGLNFSRGQKGSGMLTLDVLNMYTENIYLNISNLYRVNKEIKNDYLLKPNDIILVRSSLKQDGVGWPSLFYGYTEPVTFCGFLIRSRLATKDIDPGFLVNYLRLPRVRRHMISKSEKVAITNINQGNTSAIPIPIPSIDEQKEIETTLHACDSKIAALDNEASLHQELFRAMLEELMSGALRADSLVDAASKGCQN
jgi:type I restriction enzyme, S subunit